MPVGTIGGRTSMVRDSFGNVKPAVQASVMYNWFRSSLIFTDGTLPVLAQQTAGAELSWHFISRRSFGISAGAVLGGSFFHDNETIRLRYGPIVSFKYSRMLLTEYRYIPFIVAGVSGSFSWTAAEESTNETPNSFIASDVRLGITAGYTFLKRMQFYLAPRVFGGPVFHSSGNKTIRGRDRYFFQAGMGATVILPGEVLLFVSGSPLGERSLGGGVSKIF